MASTPDRQRAICGLFGTMNTRPGQLCDRDTEQELDTIADLLTRTVAAGRDSSDGLG